MDAKPGKPCPHALEEQAHRTELHNSRDAARQEANKPQAELDREQRERHHEEILRTMAQSVAEKSRGGRGQ